MYTSETCKQSFVDRDKIQYIYKKQYYTSQGGELKLFNSQANTDPVRRKSNCK